MTPQEQQMIDGLVERIRNTQVTGKDVAAEQYLHQGLAGYPDAVYVLAQTVLVQQYGLQQAQAQIRDLQSQVDSLQQQHAAQPVGGGSFLSHLFGGGSGPSQQQAPNPSQPPYQPVNNPGYQNYPPPPPAYGQPVAYAQPSGGGFLQGALQTAAGVAAGEMAFAGMESLFHGFGGGGGFGGGYGGGRPEEIVNNYYEDGERGGRSEEYGNRFDDQNDRNDSQNDRNDGQLDGFADSDRQDADSSNSGDDFGSVDTGSDDTDVSNDDSFGGGDDGSNY